MPKKQLKEVDKIMVKATLEYVFEKKLTGRLGEEFLNPYMGFKSGSVKAAVNRICPELKEAHEKWITERRGVKNIGAFNDKNTTIGEDKYLQALKKSGIEFENMTTEDYANALNKIRRRKN